MKNIFKCIIAVMLVLVITIGSIPLSGFVGLELPEFNLFAPKAEAATYEGTCGDNLTWAFNTETGELVISGTGRMYDWSRSSYIPWYSYCLSIKSVTLADGVTSIGDHAFYDCDSLTSITISNSVTNIGDCVFYHCDSLISIVVDINNPNYSNDVNGVLFNKNKTLLKQYPVGNTRTSYVIPDSVTTIGDYAFSGCNSLKSITIPDSVTKIDDCAFNYCYSLTSITIPNSVKSIGVYSFSGCYSLTSITISNSVTSIGDHAFYHCTSLESIVVDINNPNYSSDANGVLFNKNKTLLKQYPIGNTRTSYVIPDGVKSIGEFAFSFCYNLTSVTICSGVTSIGRRAFWGCNNLTSMTVSDSVTNIDGGAFEDCTSLTDVYYTGTEKQWKAITVGSDNGFLINATIHYNYGVEECDELKLNQESITISNNIGPIINVIEYPKGVTADSLVWSSSNDGVAYVNEDNVVTPVHYGKTDITVSTADGKYSATCEVTVEASFVITSESSNIKSVRCGDTAKYRIYFLNYNAEELPVDDVTATLTENGVLKVLSCDKYDKYIELEVKAISEGAEVI